MFKAKGKIKLIIINKEYTKLLHDNCDEVFYKDKGYERKPYLGILINLKEREYAIPLTSAKLKHLKLRKRKDIILIYSLIKSDIPPRKGIFITLKKNLYKKIYSALVISKMIPIKENTYKLAELDYVKNEDENIKKYKDLLNKELRFCIKNIKLIISRTNKIYNYQIKTKKIKYTYCDFAKLEKICDNYKISSKP